MNPHDGHPMPMPTPTPTSVSDESFWSLDALQSDQVSQHQLNMQQQQTQQQMQEPFQQQQFVSQQEPSSHDTNQPSQPPPRTLQQERQQRQQDAIAQLRQNVSMFQQQQAQQDSLHQQQQQQSGNATVDSTNQILSQYGQMLGLQSAQQNSEQNSTNRLFLDTAVRPLGGSVRDQTSDNKQASDHPKSLQHAAADMHAPLLFSQQQQHYGAPGTTETNEQPQQPLDTSARSMSQHSAQSSQQQQQQQQHQQQYSDADQSTFTQQQQQQHINILQQSFQNASQMHPIHQQSAPAAAPPMQNNAYAQHDNQYDGPLEDHKSISQFFSGENEVQSLHNAQSFPPQLQQQQQYGVYSQQYAANENSQQPQYQQIWPAEFVQSNVAPEQSAPSQQTNSLFLLPSTSIPPSVLASMYNKEQPNRARKLKAKHPRKNKSAAVKTSSKTPQAMLVSLLEHRGYTFTRIKSDDAGYDTMPSALQLASFGTHLVRAVHTSDIATLSGLLECGLSPNPCNQFRDSIVDLVCKRANETVFQCLLDHNCELQVVDGFGRTPLHHAGWASEFSRYIVEAILDRDPLQLFIEDKHGQTPLEYVRKDLYIDWIEFVNEAADKYWPVGGRPPKLVPPRDRRPKGHLPDPPNAISVSLAAMVSAGSMSPDQVGGREG